MHDNDRDLLDAFQSGDAGAFEAIIRRHGPAVLGYLTKMTHNRQQAEDLFQETFQKAYTYSGAFRGDNLRPWLVTIAARTAISRSRQERKHAAVSLNQPVCADGIHCDKLETTLPAGIAQPSEQIILDEQRRQVRDALRKLPEQQRMALVLNYYHQFSYQQIAEVLNCSVGTVKTHLFRALRKMADLLPDPAGGNQ